MDDPVIQELKDQLDIEIAYCIGMKLEDADMFEIASDTQQEDLLKAWSDYIDDHLRWISLMEEIKKIRVVAEGGKHSVVDVDKTLVKEVETILLLPTLRKNQGSDQKQKGATSKSSAGSKTLPKNQRSDQKQGATSRRSTKDNKEREILVKITANKWGDKPLYLGLRFHDLYLKWFMGNGFRYVFQDEEKKKNDEPLPPNTKLLSCETNYQSMLGIKKKTTGQLNFEGRNFVTSLSKLHDCVGSNEPPSRAIAYVILYLIEAVRFSALRRMELSLFRFSNKDTHPWDSYILDLVNDWDDYSKQLFKTNEKPKGFDPATNRPITDPFYTVHKFCGLSSVNVMDKSDIYQIIAVALGTDDSNEWAEMIEKAKEKTQSSKR